MAINHIGDRKHLTLDDRIRIETLIEHRARHVQESYHNTM